MTGDEEHRDVGIRAPKGLENGLPAHVRKVDVEDGDRMRSADMGCDSVPALAEPIDVQSATARHIRDDLPNIGSSSAIGTRQVMSGAPVSATSRLAPGDGWSPKWGGIMIVNDVPAPCSLVT
jgi:hypothetical protein